jgi:lipopolysaccharide export system protein LptA
VHQDAGAKSKQTTITTNSATIYFAKKYVKTDQLVKIVHEGVLAEAVGASADFNTNVVNLFSQVKEVYVPPETNKGKPQETAYLNSDRATYDRKNHVSSYFGNIRYTQGASFLHADKLVIYDSEVDNSIEKVVAFGAPAYYSTVPDAKGDRIDAKALRIEYYPEKKIALLIGDGELMQKGNKFSGPYITYDLNKQTILSTSGNCGKNCKQQGTMITIKP